MNAQLKPRKHAAGPVFSMIVYLPFDRRGYARRLSCRRSNRKTARFQSDHEN